MSKLPKDAIRFLSLKQWVAENPGKNILSLTEKPEGMNVDTFKYVKYLQRYSKKHKLTGIMDAFRDGDKSRFTADRSIDNVSYYKKSKKS